MKTNLSADMVKKICERLVQTDGDISTVATENGVHTTLVRRIVEKKYMRQISDEFFKANAFTKEKEKNETVESFTIPENISLSSVVDVKSSMVIEPVNEESDDASSTETEKEKRNYKLKHDFRVNYVTICTDILNSVPVDELSAKWDISIETLNHIIDGTAYRYYTKKFWNYDKDSNIVPIKPLEYQVVKEEEIPSDPIEVIKEKIFASYMDKKVSELPEQVQALIRNKLEEEIDELTFKEIKELMMS